MKNSPFKPQVDLLLKVMSIVAQVLSKPLRTVDLAQLLGTDEVLTDGIAN